MNLWVVLAPVNDEVDVKESKGVLVLEVNPYTHEAEKITLDGDLKILYKRVFKRIPTPFSEIARAGYILGRRVAKQEVIRPLARQAKEGEETFILYVNFASGFAKKDLLGVDTRCNPEGTREPVVLFEDEAVVYQYILDTCGGFHEIRDRVAQAGYALARKLAGEEVIYPAE